MQRLQSDRSACIYVCAYIYVHVHSVLAQGTVQALYVSFDSFFIANYNNYGTPLRVFANLQTGEEPICLSFPTIQMSMAL